MAKPNFIKKIRENSKFSQAVVAKVLGISRPTYIQIEKGERELTVSEAQKLASLFNLSLDNFLAGDITDNDSDNVVLAQADRQSPQKSDVRIIVPQAKKEKFKEILLYLLKKVGAKPNIGETAIYKLLYFIDFDFYEKYEEQIIGAHYIKNHYGPTPIEFKKIVDEMEEKKEIERVKSHHFQYEQKKYLPLREPRLDSLSAREIQHIDDVLARLSDKNAKELSDYSHTDIPWQVHSPGERINYESVFYRDDAHSVRQYDDEL